MRAPVSKIRVLVSGGAGQLGRELARVGHRLGIDLMALPRARLDITNRPRILDVIGALRPDVVINAAAYTNVDRAEADPTDAWRVNCDGAALLAAACAGFALPLIHVSTDYVFDGTKTTPYEEPDPIAPLGVYGASKEAGERAVRQAVREHVIVRTAWVYGEFGHNFLKTMLRLAGERDEWGVVDDQTGNPTAASDLAQALLAAAVHVVRCKGDWGTYHFAGDGDATWHEFAEEIVGIQAGFTGRRPRVRAIPTSQYPTPARRPVNSRLCSDRFATVFGVRAAPRPVRTREAVVALLRGAGDAS